jgi:NAD(P)-dependent dehydrogenase (short-subunit alcohol dehydrogenase family)
MSEGKGAGRRVFITGGGAGIGAATARLLAERGWRIALLDRDGEAAKRTPAAIGNDKARGYTCDVTDVRSVEAALDGMENAWGGIDDLINNAGTWDHAPLLELGKERWQRVMDVNFLAPIEISNAAVRRMHFGAGSGLGAEPRALLRVGPAPREFRVKNGSAGFRPAGSCPSGARPRPRRVPRPAAPGRRTPAP